MTAHLLYAVSYTAQPPHEKVRYLLDFRSTVLLCSLKNRTLVGVCNLCMFLRQEIRSCSRLNHSNESLDRVVLFCSFVFSAMILLGSLLFAKRTLLGRSAEK
jgi:hypothetical protein